MQDMGMSEIVSMEKWVEEGDGYRASRRGSRTFLSRSVGDGRERAVMGDRWLVEVRG